MKYIRYILWSLVLIAFVGFIVMNLPTKQSGDDTPNTMSIAGFNKGEHFTLTDHQGTTFDSRTSLKDGEYGLIFFGFTHCPVICPTELQKFASTMDMLPNDVADKVHPLFITIDPERDTVELMQNYVPLFHEKIVGLTGDVKNVHKVLDNWKVFYTKVNDPTLNEYTMDHSTYSYVVDKDMNILALYRMKTTDADIARSLTEIIQSRSK